MSQAAGDQRVGAHATPQAQSSAVTMDSPTTAAQAAASLASVAANISSGSSVPVTSMTSPLARAQAEAAVVAAAVNNADPSTADEYNAKLSPDTMMAAAAAGTAQIVSQPEEQHHSPQDPARLLADLQGVLKGSDSSTGLATGTAHIADVQLAYLEQLSERFYDRYESALLSNSDQKEATAAYHSLLTALDQVIQSVGLLGLAGLPVSNKKGTGLKAETQADTEMADVAETSASAAGQARATPLGKRSLLADTVAASQDAFERRERMLESAGIVTSILGMAR